MNRTAPPLPASSGSRTRRGLFPAVHLVLAPALVLVAALALAVPGHCGPTDFLVIQPGQPGTPAEAQPVMDRLAAYLTAKTGEKVTGRYANTIQDGLAALAEVQPGWGIVGLGFFAQYGRAFTMLPLASTRPGGRDTETWRLVTARTGPDDWRGLKGEVRGMTLFEKNAAPCLLFLGQKNLPAPLPFALAGTANPLKALRDAAAGKIAGCVLDNAQHQAMASLPQAAELKTVFASAELPTSPVVGFGMPRPFYGKLAKALAGAKTDPEAAELLTLLQTDGFGPADFRLPDLLLEGENGPCPR